MKYILYGIGGEAERFLFQNQGIIQDIAFCIDRRGTRKFYGLCVCSLEDISVSDYVGTHLMIVAAGDEKIYAEIKRKLCERELKEWEHFIWSKAFRKKVVVINANCHGDAIEKYLNLSAVFGNEYMVYPIPAIQLNREGEIDPALLQHTDVYIHQDIRAENAMGYKLSDEYVRKCLPKQVADICIPNFVGMGKWMYPSLGGLDRVIDAMSGPLYVLYRDKVLDEAIDYCRSFEAFREYWNNYRYDEDRLGNAFADSMNRLKKREQNWDIKIYEFIRENYRTIPCFTDANHPSKYVMRIVGRQTAELMGLCDIDDERYEPNLGLKVPILNCVSEYFKFDFKMSPERRTEYLGKRTVSEIDDYIKAYLWWYHGINVETVHEEIISCGICY